MARESGGPLGPGCRGAVVGDAATLSEVGGMRPVVSSSPRGQAAPSARGPGSARPRGGLGPAATGSGDGAASRSTTGSRGAGVMPSKTWPSGERRKRIGVAHSAS